MARAKISGTIVSNGDSAFYKWFGVDCTCPNDIQKAINEAKGEEIIFEVSSGGGDVFAGNEIAYLIQNYQGNTIAEISGVCCSAATYIPCATNESKIYPSAMFMIHNVSSSASGDYNVMDHQSNVLQTANKSVSNLYRLKTGLSESEILDLMNKETWMCAQDAVDKGFVDSIIGDNGTLLNASNQFCTILTEEMKNKARNSINHPETNEISDRDFLIQKENLKLLKMKGEYIL